MEIIIKDHQDLYKCGVYCIRNIKNDKSYIGSTTMSIKKRTDHHISLLRGNTHKNKHLQYAYNLYGEDSFKIRILENSNKDQVLIREQWYIDNTLNIYNINPLASGTPDMSKETILKRAATMKRKYASGEIVSNFEKGHIPWNKGNCGTSCSYLLGVKKTISTKVLQKWKDQGEQRRINAPEVYVYDVNYNFLISFRSSKDLEEWSLTEQNNLPIGGRFAVERMRKPINLLCSGNINKACKTSKSYKGLIFSNQPLHEEIRVEKLGKNGEG